MPLKSDHKQINIPMTTEQVSALDREAENRGLKRTELVRLLLGEAIRGFPANMPEMGSGLNEPARRQQ